MNLTQEELAQKLGLSRNYVHMIEKGRAPGETVVELFRHLESAPYPEPSKGAGTIMRDEVAVAAKQPSQLRAVPVVSWASAGSCHNYHDLCEFLDETVSTDAQDPNAFALIVEGDSMEPVYRTGDRLVITPNIAVINGDVVIARHEKHGNVWFKLYHQTGPRGDIVRLTSYNPAYPPLEHRYDEFRFIYPVYSMTRRTRGR